MKEIPLTKGYVTQVDDLDYETIARHKWFVITPDGPTGRKYAARYHDGNMLYLHRQLMQDALNAERPHVDHRDGNGLNNQRSNLRTCSRADNQRNRKLKPRAGRTSAYKGVSRTKSGWVARINNTVGHQQHLGTFADEITAAKAYDNAAFQYHGEFALVNFTPEVA